MNSNTDTRAVSVLVPCLKRNGWVLVYLQKRTKDAKRLPDHLGFSGGGVEEGETPEEALVREIKEELGYAPKNHRFLGAYDFPEYRVKLYVFCEQVSDNFENTVKVREGQYGKFFTEEELMREPKVAPWDRATLQNIFQKLKNEEG